MELYFWIVGVGFGVCQGILLLGVLASTGVTRSPTGRRLLALVAVVTIILSDFLFMLAGGYERLPHATWSAVWMLFLMGPLVFEFVRSVTGSSLFGRWRLVVHVLPLLWVLWAGLGSFYLLPPDVKLALFRGERLTDAPSARYFDAVFFSETLLYLAAAAIILVRFREKHLTRSADTRIVPFGWILGVLLVVASYLALHAAATLMPAPIATVVRYVDYPVILSLLIHGLAVAAIVNPGLLEFGIPVPEKVSPEAQSSRKYQTSPLGESESADIAARLAAVMEQDRLYLDPELTLTLVAERLGVPAHHVSQVLNQRLQVNFYTFVNRFRVEAVKSRLESDGNGRSLLALALDAGFNSKASFNRVFKKEVGMTPSQYVRQVD